MGQRQKKGSKNISEVLYARRKREKTTKGKEAIRKHQDRRNLS